MSHRVNEGGLKQNNRNILECLKEKVTLVNRLRADTKVLILRLVNRQNPHQFNVLLFQCSLQLILNVLTYGLVPPSLVQNKKSYRILRALNYKGVE